MILLHIVIPDERSLLAAHPGYVGKGGLWMLRTVVNLGQ